MSLKGSAESGGTLRGKLNHLHELRGYSAYEVAVINGFNGTEEEWLASLKGEKGQPGVSGRGGAWYGTTSTKAETAEKVVTTITGDFRLEQGARIGVKFLTNTVNCNSLIVDGTAKTYIRSTNDEAGNASTATPITWHNKGQVQYFTYDGEYFIIDDSIRATAGNSLCGKVAVSDSVSSEGDTVASSKAVKTAYNKAVEALNAFNDGLPTAINNALEQAKNSGQFNGADGKDYLLTDADKQEIASLVDVSGGGGSVELDTTLTKAGQAADAEAVGNAISKLSADKADSESLDLVFHDGKLYITVNGVRKGNGVIIGTVEETVYHNILLNLTNCVSSNTATTAEEHSEYTTVISAIDGYVMNLLNVTMGGEALSTNNGTIHIEDVTGEIQITASAVVGDSGDIDVSGIVEWYQQPTRDALEYVQSLSSDYAHYVVVTDVHIAWNQKNSPAIIKALMETGKFDKYVCLGDMINGDMTRYEESVEAGFWYGLDEGKMLFALGNHDVDIEESWWAENIFTKIPGTFDDAATNKTYYYYDNEQAKIRFIVSSCVTSDAQTSFIKNLINTMPDGYKYMILGHYSHTNNALLRQVQYNRNGYLGCLHGHGETDSLTLYHDYLYDVQFTGDSSSSGGNRVNGTATEQALTIVSINPNTNNVKFYRIGGIAADGISVGVTDDKMYEITQSVEPPETFPFRIDQSGNFEESTEFVFYTDKVPVTNGDEIYVWYPNFTPITLSNVRSAMYSGETCDTYLGIVYLSKIDWFPVSRYTVSNADAAIVQVATPVGAEYSRQFPSIQSLAYDSSLWITGYVSSGGQLKRSGAGKAISQAVRVKPNTTYRLTQDTTAIGSLYLKEWADPTTVVTNRRSINSDTNSVEFTTGANVYYVAFSVTTPAADMSTATLEEVTS